MQGLRNRDIFRFCAIPQIMSIGTLAQLYNNGKVFEGEHCSPAAGIVSASTGVVVGNRWSWWCAAGLRGVRNYLHEVWLVASYHWCQCVGSQLSLLPTGNCSECFQVFVLPGQKLRYAGSTARCITALAAAE